MSAFLLNMEIEKIKSIQSFFEKRTQIEFNLGISFCPEISFA